MDGRWELLFADLEGEARAGERAGWDGEVADRTRGEVGRLRFADRLRAAVGHPVELTLLGADRFLGVVREVGPDWLLATPTLHAGSPAPTGASALDALVAVQAICGVSGLGALSAQPGTEGRVAARLDLRYALRRLARDRSPVAITLMNGDVLAGTCDRVGADFVEVAEHVPGEQRRARAVRRVRTIPLGALVLLRPA
jgi:hypothetical protein